MELDPLKIIRENLVRTGFMDKYNELVDVVIYKVETDGSNLIFYTNVDTTIIPLTSSISQLLDVELTNSTSGQVLLYDGNKWVNTNFNPSDLEYIRPDQSTRPELSDVGDITSITQALDKILYPYQEPVFSSFTITGKPNTLELGQGLISIGGENVTFSWGVTNILNISTTTGYDINDTTGSNLLDSNILPNTTTSKSINIPNQIVKTSNGETHLFTIIGTNTNNDSFTRNKSYIWRPRRLWGTSPNGGALNNSEILSLTGTNTGGSELSDTRTKTWSMDGNGEYLHYYWEESIGDTNGILVGNLPNTAWTKHTVSFENQYGHVTNYIGYVTNTIQFGTNISIQFT